MQAQRLLSIHIEKESGATCGSKVVAANAVLTIRRTFYIVTSWLDSHNIPTTDSALQWNWPGQVDIAGTVASSSRLFRSLRGVSYGVWVWWFIGFIKLEHTIVNTQTGKAQRIWPFLGSSFCFCPHFEVYDEMPIGNVQVFLLFCNQVPVFDHPSFLWCFCFSITVYIVEATWEPEPCLRPATGSFFATS